MDPEAVDKEGDRNPAQREVARVAHRGGDGDRLPLGGGATPAEAGLLASAQYGFSLGLMLFTLLFLVLYACLGRPIKVASSTDGE